MAVGNGMEGPMFTELFPILAVRDMERALRLYRDLLGASVTCEFPGRDGAPACVGLRIGASSLG